MNSFDELPLSPELRQAIKDAGFEKPSPIQAQALPILLREDRPDFIGLAGTGTGKTATFALPLLESIDPDAGAVQAVILCPTRELALQVAGQIDLLGRRKRVRSVAIYGGSSYSDQIRGLRQGATIVVGTPGRVADHIAQGTLKLDSLKVLVLDEADEMFSMGFKEELDAALERIPRETCRVWLFSATMSPDVRRVADSHLRKPEIVQVNREEMLSAGVQQLYFPVQEHEKPEVIRQLIDAADDFYGLIFCQTKALVADLAAYLHDRGYKVDSLHGDKDQAARERTMQAFREKRAHILVCTDVAARGLDVQDITHVINYSLPRELDAYVHRIGRTARSGKTGMALNLVSYRHRDLIVRIERMTKSHMELGTLPSRREIAARKVDRLLPSFQEQPFASRVFDVLSDDWKAALEGLSAEDVAARFLSMTMPDVFADAQGGAPSAPAERRSPRPSAPRTERRFETRSRDERPQRVVAPAREADEFVAPVERAPRFERAPRPERAPRAEYAPRPERGPRPQRDEGAPFRPRPARLKATEPTAFKLGGPKSKKTIKPKGLGKSGARLPQKVSASDVPEGLNRRDRRAVMFGRSQDA